MSPRIKSRPVETGKVFDLKSGPMRRGEWLWWFWLFFFDNPLDPGKPRQLMILWSAKNSRQIDCNSLIIRPVLPVGRDNLDGAVAAWYFDGERMRHNFVLERCMLHVSEKGLYAETNMPTAFEIEGGLSTVRIGDDFTFLARVEGRDNFLRPSLHGNDFLAGKGYSILKMNRLALDGVVDGMPVKGSAYFQRVIVNGPAIPWFWGAFHFREGAVLTYTNQFMFGKAVKKHIAFYDRGTLREFHKIKVKRLRGKMPVFCVSGEAPGESIRFTVTPYSHSSWTFKKKSLRLVPNKLVYNEYPAVLSDFEYVDEAGNCTKTLEELGPAVGNAEHATGYLF